MPIYEPDLSYEDMKKAVDTFKCAKCDSGLIIAWSGQKNSYMLRCRETPEHEGVVPWGRDPGLMEIANKLWRRPLPMESTALVKMDKNTMLARVMKAKWPKELTAPEKELITTISIEYGLDPLFGELMVYQGRPYVTIDARRRKAQETGNLDGISSRPATELERTARQVTEGDYLFVAEVRVRGAAHPFEGWGKVRASETKGSEHLPVVKDPAAMAEKRAEAQALRRAFHIPLPSFEEVIEGEFRELPPEKEAAKSKSSSSKAASSSTTPPQRGEATPAQVTKIWADAGKMGYTDDEVHAIAKDRWGVGSVKDLNVNQASSLIDLIAKGEGLSASEQQE